MTIEARFNGRLGDFKLNVDFCISTDGITGLFGESGSGKTSLLRAIAGLEYHQGGYLKVGNALLQKDELFVPPHQRSIAYVFQEASLFTHLTVKSNLEYGLKRLLPSKHKVSLEQAIELLGIGKLLKQYPHELSGGERQRVAIAQALAVSPGLLLMDEPLAGLDMNRKQEILPYISSLPKKLDISVLYVSHVSDEIIRLADRLMLLKDGDIQAIGAIDSLLTRFDLPLAHDKDAAAMIEAVVVEHDENYHLTYLEFAGGRITLTRQAIKIGQSVRLRLAARDVSLTLAQQTDTSILNIWSATVDELTDEKTGQVMVRLLVAGIPILSRLTQKSVIDMALQPGKSVYVQIKSIALLD